MPDEPAIGIDLGTTFSVIASVDSTGRPVTILNAEGDHTTPSAIFFDGDEVIVGKEALKAAPLEPDHVALYAKRDMGSPVYSKSLGGEHLPPEVVQSFILQKLKEDGERKIGPFTKAVVTVPAFFNEPRRKATQDAGSLAGLDVIDIINEPTAAAIAYGVQEKFISESGAAKKREVVLVYDLGGGTFDVTLMVIEGRNYHAVATAGDVYLGGIDWDRRIVDFLGESFEEKFGTDPRKNSKGLQRLLRDAEDAKRSLSSREHTKITLEYQGEGLRVDLTRDQFNQMTKDLLDRTRFTVQQVLSDAKIDWDDVTRILLVGGSTRMPQVQEMLTEYWGKPVDRSLSADEAVAHGAAIYANILMTQKSGGEAQAVVTNVNSHNLAVLGIEQATGRPRSSIMIPKNSALPAKMKKRFSTAKDNQRSVKVNVVEGGDKSGNHATPIGKCIVRGLPPNLPSGTPVDVIFSYMANGRLGVKAVIPGYNIQATLDIERSGGMSDDQVKKWKRQLSQGGSPLTFD